MESVLRRRTDSNAEKEDEPTETPPTRSTEYWLDDGDIILQVETTQFRLGKTMLAMHSSVFRDLFTLPIPIDEPMIDNCAVVVLSGDTAQDWTLFLRALFPKFYLSEVPSLELLAAMLRLSKKYDFPLFRADCTGSEWTNFTTAANQYAEQLLACLVREMGLPSLLPLSYCYIICDQQGEAMAKVLDPTNTSVDATDRFACLLGYPKLLKLQFTTMLAWLDFKAGSAIIPTQTCEQPA
ncbi:hypothetical protein B0H16DRAFT_1794032 [Mycena metata]|uniref:BTB domain-containing protein n=1 Tax=Mycena metata TaxID=1033252 RepID=A0AAD7HGW4_9AGAR|nr:hypothetical protein B0H16DRAFT_1794032 [Mycena metata]